MKSTIQFPWLFSSSWKNNLQLVKKLFLLASWLLFQANIFAQCNNLTCKTDTIPVYLATNCQVILDPLNFIQTPPTDCPGSKFALAFDALNNPIGIINNTYINQILNITVFDINSGKKCDSHILVKDTMAPILVCQSDITVHCNLSISPADLPTPIAVDNCGGFLSLVNTDVIINNPCPLLDMVFRTWKATDASGNTKTCLSTITRTGSCIAPTTQASNITFSSVGSNQMTVNWTNGNGGSRIVKINKSNSFTNPVNGVSPTANSAYSGSGEQVIYNNSGSSITVTGLLPNTTYWFRVYEANCSGASILYNATLATKNPNSQATQASSCIAVSILSQPVPNQSVIVNGTATFSIVAGGTNDYTYQWYKGTTPLTGTGKTSPT
ncbi:MAG TPA: fibronectin type III domain-containing protein, partial [Saprospiraceae bacterium]|nr:fibronectin type III domain-containing protein [Saprospiraceae bacterium]